MQLSLLRFSRTVTEVKNRALRDIKSGPEAVLVLRLSGWGLYFHQSTTARCVPTGSLARTGQASGAWSAGACAAKITTKSQEWPQEKNREVFYNQAL